MYKNWINKDSWINWIKTESNIAQNVIASFPSSKWALRPDPPGVDIMITIFGIFGIFWRKNWRFSQKSMLMIKILHSLALFWVKNAIFCRFFGETIFKTITSDPPGHQLVGQLAETSPEDEGLGLRVDTARDLHVVHLEKYSARGDRMCATPKCKHTPFSVKISTLLLPRSG
jgi:hypothetical protein